MGSGRLLELAMTDNQAAHNVRANELTGHVGNGSVVPLARIGDGRKSRG